MQQPLLADSFSHLSNFLWIVKYDLIWMNNRIDNSIYKIWRTFSKSVYNTNRRFLYRNGLGPVKNEAVDILIHMHIKMDGG